MKRHERLEKEGMMFFDSFYSEYGNEEEMKKPFLDKAIRAGYTRIKIFRVKSDTNGLKRFEVWVNSIDRKCKCIKEIREFCEIGEICKYEIKSNSIIVYPNGNNLGYAGFNTRQHFNEYFEEVK